jgi:hypothetical protein
MGKHEKEEPWFVCNCTSNTCTWAYDRWLRVPGAWPRPSVCISLASIRSKVNQTAHALILHRYECTTAHANQTGG